jgi:hypothetical protein
MIRSFALMAGAAAIAVAPVTAQAAPSRAAAPVTGESEEVRGSPFLAPIIIAIIVALAIVATTSGDDPQSP